MGEKADFLQLEQGDDATSVRDRLSFMRGRRVLLVWPEDGTVLTRKLDLVLVQREAMRRAVRIAIVTHDPEIVKHARELNISTFETIGAAERGRWRRGRVKVFANRFQRPDDEPDAETLKPVASRVRRDPAEDEERERRSLLPRLLVLALLVGVTLGVAYVLIPSAVVTITPASERVPVNLNLVADPQTGDVDLENGIIPAVTLRVEIEETGTLPTTGTRALADIPARGSVVFINQTGEEVEIPADTAVSTSAGTPIVFRTTETALAPAEIGGQIEVPIEALPGSGGTVGNVEAGLVNTIVGTLSESLTVRNLQPTSGGESQIVSVIMQDDADRLLATLRQQLQSRAYLGMEAQRTEAQTIILETIRIVEEREDWKTWSGQPGDAADTLTLTMRARVEATVIDESLAEQVAFAALTAQIPPGRALVPGTTVYTCCNVSTIDEAGRVTFAIDGEGLIAGQVNAGQLQERLTHRTPDDARRYVLTEVDLADDTLPVITISPDWFGRMPVLPMRISVQVQDAPAS